MTVSLVAPGPGANVQAVIQSLYSAVRQLQSPDGPQPVFSITKIKLPPAASYPQCVTLVTDLGVLAVSNGTAWVRQDTGAPV